MEFAFRPKGIKAKKGIFGLSMRRIGGELVK
jgi:hypothetical protein